MTKYELRDYMQTLLSDIRTELLAGNRAVLAVSPTGSGKMSLLTYIAKVSSDKGVRVYLCFHVRKLCYQASSWLQRWGARYGIMMAGEPNVDPDALIQVCMVQSIRGKLDKIAVPGMMIWDEGHHGASDTHQKLRSTWKDSWLISFTATPIRLSGEPLLGEGDDTFDVMVEGPKVSWLTENGYICPVKLMTQPEIIDVRNVDIKAGDFDEEQLDRLYSDDLIGRQVGNAVEEYKKYINGQPALARCLNVRHAMKVAKLFSDAGYPAKCVHGAMKEDDIIEAVLEFEAGYLKLLSYCKIFGEGVDIPAASGLFFLAHTASLVDWLQNCGRVMRPAEGKEFAYVFDHVGNAYRDFCGQPMGHPGEDRNWKDIILRQQEERQGRARKGRVIEMVYKRCPECTEVVAARVNVCDCGHNFVEAAKKEEEQKAIEAALVEYEARKNHMERVKAQSYEDLVKYARMRGYKDGWARIVWEQRQKKKGKKKEG